MGKTVFGPGGGAVPSARPDEKMGAERALLYLNWFPGEEIGPWRVGRCPGFNRVMKRSTTKKRRQRDRQLEDD